MTSTAPDVIASDSISARSNVRSMEIMARARDRFPGGVNSPVRAFRGVGGEPFVAARGEGARVWDVDGNEYIDYILSWGPLILGHAPKVVLHAAGHEFRYADWSRSRTGRSHHGTHAAHRTDALHEQRH